MLVSNRCSNRGRCLAMGTPSAALCLPVAPLHVVQLAILVRLPLLAFLPLLQSFLFLRIMLLPLLFALLLLLLLALHAPELGIRLTLQSLHQCQACRLHVFVLGRAKAVSSAPADNLARLGPLLLLQSGQDLLVCLLDAPVLLQLPLVRGPHAVALPLLPAPRWRPLGGAAIGPARALRLPLLRPRPLGSGIPLVGLLDLSRPIHCTTAAASGTADGRGSHGP
mmetsp:Transcript_60794/g.168543  ORF Transcript_60794/g.168543 Transcript_60794/m.168543 type:complete len:223 (+) Transcript_60794:1252-1920(+)